MDLFRFSETIPLNVLGQFSAAWSKFSYVNINQELIVDNVRLKNAGGALKFLDSDTRAVYYDAEGKNYNEVNLKGNVEVRSLGRLTPLSVTLRESDVVLSFLEKFGSSFMTKFFLAENPSFEIIKDLEAISDHRVVGRINNILIVKNKFGTEIMGYEVKDDKFIWRITDVDGQSITKADVLSVTDGNLYVKINRNLIAEIEVENGEVKRTWSNVFYQQPGYVPTREERKTITPYSAPNCLLNNKTTIASLHEDGYHEINLLTGKSNYYYLRDYFKEEKITLFTGQVTYTYKDLILFSSQYFNIEKNIIEYALGAFDPKNRRVVSRYVFDSDKVGRGIKGPVANDNQAFVLDFNNHLHVFDFLV